MLIFNSITLYLYLFLTYIKTSHMEVLHDYDVLICQ